MSHPWYDLPVVTTIVVGAVLAGALVSLLRAIRAGDRALEVVSKTAASLCFVVLGAIRWTAGDAVGSWLLTGLVLCMVGDVLLLGSDRSFDLGLAAFLLGHLAYVGGFRAALPLAGWPVMIAVPLAVAGIAVGAWLWPRLGRRRPSVTVYIAVISLMVWGGLATSSSLALPWTAAAGALLFYLSDLAVARQRFVRPDFVNRAVGLPLYYAGQLLLALTIQGS